MPVGAQSIRSSCSSSQPGPATGDAVGQPGAQPAVGGHDQQRRAVARQLARRLDQGVVPAAGRPHHPDAVRCRHVARPALDHGDDLGARPATVRAAGAAPGQRGQPAEQPRRRAGAVAPPAVGPRAHDVRDVDEQHRHDRLPPRPPTGRTVIIPGLPRP